MLGAAGLSWPPNPLMWGWDGWAEFHMLLTSLIKLKYVGLTLLCVWTQEFVPSVAAFCGDVLSTYCLKEEGNEQHQSKNLRISSEMLLKDHLSLSLSPVLSLVPSFNDAVWVTGSSDCSQFAVGLCCSPRFCHALISSINLPLRHWKSQRQQDLKRETSLFFHSAGTEKHLFKAVQWYRCSPNSSWPSWNSEEGEVGSTTLIYWICYN